MCCKHSAKWREFSVRILFTLRHHPFGSQATFTVWHAAGGSPVTVAEREPVQGVAQVTTGRLWRFKSVAVRTYVPGWSFRNTRDWKSDCVPLTNAATIQHTWHTSKLSTPSETPKDSVVIIDSAPLILCVCLNQAGKQCHQIFRSVPKSYRLQGACNDRLVPWFMRQEITLSLGFRTTQVMKAKRNHGWLPWLCWAPSGWWNLDFFWSAKACK